MSHSKGKYLTDVFILAFSAFGGPQAHVALLFQRMVDERKYVTEKELIELNALCQILPGPTSTQTITALGYKLGGIPLAFITLLIWLLPAAIGMISIAIGFQHLQEQQISLDFMKYVKPMAIGFICFAAYKIGAKVLRERIQWILAFFSLIASVLILIILERSFLTALVFPLLLIIGGVITATLKKKSEVIKTEPIKIKWTYLIIFLTILIGSTISTFFVQNEFLGLFDKFYRNGSMIFGGGDVLIPFLQGEFVETEKLLTNDEFLNGYAMVRAMPGPMFSFCGYLGAMSATEMPILGGIVGILGVFLPGTLLIFFLIDFWDQLKKLPVVSNSLAGITAISVGLISAAAVTLLVYTIDINDVPRSSLNLGIVVLTFLILRFTKIPAPFIIMAGIGVGFI